MVLLFPITFSLPHLLYFLRLHRPKCLVQLFWRIEALFDFVNVFEGLLTSWFSQIFHFPVLQLFQHMFLHVHFSFFCVDLYIQFVSQTCHRPMWKPMSSCRFRQSHKVHRLASDPRNGDNLRRRRVFWKGRLGCPNLQYLAQFLRLVIQLSRDRSHNLSNSNLNCVGGIIHPRFWNTRDAKRDSLPLHFNKSIRNRVNSLNALSLLSVYL